MKTEVLTKEADNAPELPFTDIAVGDTFRLATGKAIYMKVQIRHEKENRFRMLELLTGDVFMPSASSCVRVATQVTTE